MKVHELITLVKEKKSKFIVITGGVRSSIGKGVLVSSLGVLLKNAGYAVAVAKWDPYLNVDPGTMSPLEHGEVFVTGDGAETDLDLGHYERILGISLTKDSSVSSGQIFQEILEGERKGTFLGKCIQLVPHVFEAIKKRLLAFAIKQQSDFVLIEIGGTVGDIEGQVFLEAIRQIRMQLGYGMIFHGHLSYVPLLEWTGEVKTKPTQHSVNALKEGGLVPDCLFLRASKLVPSKSLEKLAQLCGVDQQLIFQVLTYNPLYQLFLDLKEQGVAERIQNYFKLSTHEPDLTAWQALLRKIEYCKKTVKIALVAKYVGSNDPYISVVEATKSAAFHGGYRSEIIVIEAEHLEKNDPKGQEAWENIKKSDGIIVPGGFDKRGSEGKIEAVRWAREHKIPYLGLCLGMQMMIVEFARSLVGLKEANTTEFIKNTPHPVIALLDEQKEVAYKGGSMRLGALECELIPETKAYSAYQQRIIVERHRHRYEFNNHYKKAFEQVGVVFSGIYKAENLVEVAELKDHPFMVGTQFHPEFLSSPLHPHPLFKAFIKAALAIKEKNKEHSV